MVMVSKGARLIVAGCSKRGKQLEKLCTVWEVVDTADHVLFCTEPGPWLFIQPLVEDRSVKLREARWAHGYHDVNLTFIKAL